jgi:hypothetical protein
MEIGRGVSIAAVVVAVISIFIPLYGIYLVIIGTILAITSALYGERPVTIGATLINLFNVLFLSPSLYLFLNLQRMANGNNTGLFWMVVVLLLCLPFLAMILHSNGLFRIPQPASAHGNNFWQPGPNGPAASGRSVANARPEPQQGWLLSAVLPNGEIVRRHIQTDARPLTIGRSSEKVDFVLDDDSISRQHARLEVRGRALWISDLHSLNGTEVAGQPVGIDPVCVEPADRIQLGTVRLSISAL